jgi:ABC-type glycerol-3-phosphate transport system permease component
MFFALLIVTFFIAVAVAFGVVRSFDQPIGAIFKRIIQDDISVVWQKYVKFAAYVVGISGGVRIYHLERYIQPESTAEHIPQLTPERWTLEVYRTVIETLQSLAWMYLVVFIFSLIAYVIVRGFEFRKSRKET